MVNVFILIIGALIGWFMEKITVVLINKRINEPFDQRFSGNLKRTLVWVITNAIAWSSIFLMGGLSIYTIESSIILSACMILSAVDISIKKIPNELLLALLIVHLLAVLTSNQLGRIDQSFYGFVIGAFMFILPFFIGKGAGLGDVKFAAVSGFILGAYGFLISVLIMTLLLIIYTIYLVVTHKGGLKTKLALGPFMASGVVAVMMLNIVNGQEIFWFVANLK